DGQRRTGGAPAGEPAAAAEPALPRDDHQARPAPAPRPRPDDRPGRRQAAARPGDPGVGQPAGAGGAPRRRRRGGPPGRMTGDGDRAATGPERLRGLRRPPPARAMMARVKRSRVLPALALTAALTLAGCSGLGSDPGVSVNGQEFSVAELQEATAQLNQAAEQPAGPQQVVADLALLPLLEEVFAGSPAVVSESQVREVLTASGVGDPGPATLAAATSRQ